MKGTMVEADPGTWYLRVYDRIADRQVRRTVKGSKRQAETELARFVAEATPRAQEPLSCKGFDVVDMSPTSGWDQRVEGGSMRWALILWARASRSCWFSACSSARRARRASSCWRRESAVVCSAVGVDVRPVRGCDWRRWLLPRRGLRRWRRNQIPGLFRIGKLMRVNWKVFLSSTEILAGSGI